MDKFKVIEEKEPMTSLDKNLIELQKTIIYYGEKILEEIKTLKIDNKKIEITDNSEPITAHLKRIIAHGC